MVVEHTEIFNRYSHRAETSKACRKAGSSRVKCLRIKKKNLSKSFRKGLKLTRWELILGLMLILLATNLPNVTVFFFFFMLYAWCLTCTIQKYDLLVHQSRVVREANEGIRKPTYRKLVGIDQAPTSLRIRNYTPDWCECHEYIDKINKKK